MCLIQSVAIDHRRLGPHIQNLYFQKIKTGWSNTVRDIWKSLKAPYELHWECLAVTICGFIWFLTIVSTFHAASKADWQQKRVKGRLPLKVATKLAAQGQKIKETKSIRYLGKTWFCSRSLDCGRLGTPPRIFHKFPSCLLKFASSILIWRIVPWDRIMRAPILICLSALIWHVLAPCRRAIIAEPSTFGSICVFDYHLRVLLFVDVVKMMLWFSYEKETPRISGEHHVSLNACTPPLQKPALHASASRLARFTAHENFVCWAVQCNQSHEPLVRAPSNVFQAAPCGVGILHLPALVKN